MADRVIWIAWGSPIHGREERAVEVFGESAAYWGELQAEGRIERFDVTLLGPNSDLNGFAVLYGTHQQFAELVEEERWIRSVVNASLVIEDLRIIEGITGDALGERMGIYREAASQMAAAS